MRISKEQYLQALKNGCGEMSIGAISYVNFGTYGLSVTYPKRTRDGVLVLTKYVNDWKNKTLEGINKELAEQSWQ